MVEARGRDDVVLLAARRNFVGLRAVTLPFYTPRPFVYVLGRVVVLK